ncbi:MAG: response regulator [Christensenella sp.]|nr:response regulator [Christensenella sp.]
MYRVAVADADLKTRALCREVADEDGRFVVAGEFHDAHKALDFLRRGEIDLLIVDWQLAAPCGADLLRDLLAEGLDADVIVTAAQGDARDLGDALRLGAMDFIIKPFLKERLVQAFDRYAGRCAAVLALTTADQQTIDYLLHYPDSSTADPARSGKKTDAATVEKIMDCFRWDENAVFTVKEIARRCCLSEVTARRYLKGLAAAGRILGDVDYRTGGHPRVKYHLPHIH